MCLAFLNILDQSNNSINYGDPQDTAFRSFLLLLKNRSCEVNINYIFDLQ